MPGGYSCETNGAGLTSEPMKNWIRYIADDADQEDPFTTHVPLTQVETILTSDDSIAFRLIDGGMLHVEGNGVENLINDLLEKGEPLLVKGQSGITSVR